MLRRWVLLLGIMTALCLTVLPSSMGQEPTEPLSPAPLLDPERVERLEAQAEEVRRQGEAIYEASREARPLQAPFLPGLAAWLFQDFNPGVAGLLLIISAGFRGWRMGLLLVPAALIALLGDHLGIPAVGGLTSREMSLIAAVSLGILGFLVGRERR